MPTPQSGNHDRKPDVDVSNMPASPGNASVVQTPKDVSPDEAASRDVTERNVNSENPQEREEALLDDAIELSFPASDPISVPSITKVNPEEKAKNAGTSEKKPPEFPAPGKKH